jgi:hypothetical protein
LNDVPAPRRTKLAWLAYLALVTLFAIVGETRNVVVHGLPAAATIANWLLTIALLTAAWCYALQRPLGTPGYWRAVFWIVFAATLVMLVPVALAGAIAIAYTAVLLLLVAPAYVAAYLYAYRSPQLWNPAAPRGEP